MAARVLLLITLLTGHAMLAMAIPKQALTSFCLESQNIA